MREWVEDELLQSRSRVGWVLNEQRNHPEVLGGVTLVPFLILCLEGRLGLPYEGEHGPDLSRWLNAGDFAWFRPNSYANAYQSEIKHYLRFTFEPGATLMLRASLIPGRKLNSGYPDLRYSAILNHPGAYERAVSILDTTDSDVVTPRARIRLRLKTESLLMDLAESVAKDSARVVSKSARWEAISLYVDDQFGKPINRASVAQTFDLSSGTLSRLCRDFTGLSFHHWLEEKRLKHARRLLEDTSRPIADIAIQCGYTSSSLFCQVFKRRTHQTPNEWRQQPR